MTFTSVAAICLLVDKLERSIAFYRDVLGLEVNYTEGGFANFKLEGTELALFERGPATTMFPARYMKPTGGAMVCFRVSDLPEAASMLRERGAVIFEGPKEMPWGQKVLYLHDPDGVIIEISQMEDTAA